MSNEEVIEEMSWLAYQKGLGIQLVELAGTKMRDDHKDRMSAYDEAYRELGLTDDQII